MAQADRFKYHCPNCGDGVVAERWKLGYQYCKRQECFEMLGRKAGVTMFDKPPRPGEIDLDPMELEGVDEFYQDSD